MGLDTQHVESDDRHYGAFECAICQTIVDLDALVTTVCSHPFCKRCLQQWLDRDDNRNKHCPSCNTGLLFGQNGNYSSVPSSRNTMMMGDQSVLVRPLQEHQPLAYRVLLRIKVSCPLADCKWTGDYGDLQHHLVSDTEHKESYTASDATASSVPDSISETAARQKRLAESYKEQANQQYSSGHYVAAKDLYTKAIEICAEVDETRRERAILRSNRAAVHLVLQDYSSAIADCEIAERLDPSFVKPYIRHARALIQLGNFDASCSLLSNALFKRLVDATSLLKKQFEECARLKELYEKAQTHLKNQEFAAAKSSFGTLLGSTVAVSVVLGAARADLGLGLTDSARRLVCKVLRQDKNSADAYLIHGQCYILMGEFENGLKCIKEAMRMDPDQVDGKSLYKACSRANQLILSARDSFFHRKFSQAAETFTEAMNACQPLPPNAPLFGILHTERARSYLRLKDYAAALKDCALVLYQRDDSVDAWLVRLQALHGLNRHEEALSDVSQLMEKWGSGEPRIRKAYETADFEVRKSKRPDYYELLGVSKVASEREIKKAYRSRSLEVHPDRFSGEQYTDAQREKAKRDFLALGEALEVLTNDAQRQLYDEGYDLEAIKERMEAAQRAAHHHGQGGHHRGHW